MNDVTLFENKWCSVIERQLDNGLKWVFSRHTWCNSLGVAVLPYRKVLVNPGWNFYEYVYLVHMELCPAHDTEMQGMYAIAGGMDKPDEGVWDVAVRELQEEAGITVSPDKLQYLGRCRASKSSDSELHLFAVDVEGLPQGTASGDGTFNEELAYSEWVPAKDLVQFGEPVLGTMLLRLMGEQGRLH